VAEGGIPVRVMNRVQVLSFHSSIAAGHTAAYYPWIDPGVAE